MTTVIQKASEERSKGALRRDSQVGLSSLPDVHLSTPC